MYSSAKSDFTCCSLVRVNLRTVGNDQLSDFDAGHKVLRSGYLSTVEDSSFAYTSGHECSFRIKHIRMLLHRDQVTISPTNLSPVVSICSIVCLLLSTLSVAGRIFTKAAVVRRLAVDDFAILSATVHAIPITKWASLKLHA